MLIFLVQGCVSKGTESLSDTVAQSSGTDGSSGGQATSLGFVVTGILPSAGSFVGNYNVSISGSQFTATTTFTIGGTPCITSTVVSSSSAVCKIPAGSIGLQDVVASKGAELSTLASGFRYTGAATLTAVSPTLGPATIPTLITLTGTNFIEGASVNISHPTLALSPCQPVTIVNATTITCYTPPLTASQSHAIRASAILSSIVITNPDGTLISLNTSFDFTPAPQYTSVSYGASGVSFPPLDGVLNSGLGVYTMTVNGNYFEAGMTLKVGSSAAGSCSYVNSSQMTCTSLPVAGATEGNYNITLTNLDGQTVIQPLFFSLKPTITSLNPTQARFTGGDIVTINGTGLGIAAVISIYNNAIPIAI